jgi:hypothetical protein
MSNLGKPISKSCISSCLARIAKNWSFYLKRFCLVVVFLLILQFSNLVLAQALDHPVTLSNQDVVDTISAFKTDNPSKSVQKFKANMPPVTDKKTREFVFNNPPKTISNLQIKDIELETKVRILINPLLSLYGRENAYIIVIFKHSVPFIALDTGTVLFISTGFLLEAESVDEILGSVAHELGHEYFTEYSIITKHLIGLTKIDGSKTALTNKFGEVLSIIELECDAFSSLTLAYLGYDPTAFINGIERMTGKYKAKLNSLHPATNLRRQVVENVIPSILIKENNRKVSLYLREIKDIIITKTGDDNLNLRDMK